MSSTVGKLVTAEHDGSFDRITQEMTTPAFRQDPYALWARMRREYPVYRSSNGVWYLTRYTDVDAALRDLRLSKDRERMRRWFAQAAALELGRSQAQERLGLSMLHTDPPDHTRLRKSVNVAFTARRVQGLRPRIEAMVDELLDAAVAAGPPTDLMAALAYPLPLTVICELVGVPLSDGERIVEWSRQLVNHTEVAPTPEVFQRVDQAAEEFLDYMEGLVRRRRAEPGEDILSALIAIQERGDQLTDDELLSTCYLLLVAGHETTANLIGNGMLALLRHPDQLRRLQQDPALIRPAVEELLRYDSSVQRVTRIVVGEVEVGGQKLGDGEFVSLVLAAANRDPDQFPDPDRLDLGRTDNRHLSFGSGPHFCLGARLTRLESEIAIGALVRRLPALRLATDVIQWRPKPALRGLERLIVTY